ncbi:MAG: alkaline phosphatase family protein [Hungatella sp.]|nr:alkaline phosphatase family protein [Hungatella sp.]
MSKRKIIVFSCDAMVYEDIRYLLTKPSFCALYKKGAMVKRIRTVYPSVTYTCHTSMSSGCYPDKHGVTGNMKFMPGRLKPMPWQWFADAIKCPDIFTAAKRAGLSTAAVFWPVTGNHPDIDYLVDEYWPQSKEDTKEACFLRSGTTREVYDTCVAPHIGPVTVRTHPDTDQFLVDCACEMIRHYRPDLLMLHTADVDSYRHHTGLFTEQVKRGLDDTERWFTQIIRTTKEAGVFEETNFFLVSDHGQMEIVRSLKPNVMLARNGLIRVDRAGEVADWQAYCQSNGLSALIRLRDPGDRELWKKTYELLLALQREGVYGISRVYTREEIREKEHLDGDFSFVIETDGYTSFSEDWREPLIKELDLSDYRLGRATPGHHPDKGPQPILFAFGPDIREGVEVEEKPVVDEVPTYGKILGLSLPSADGQPIDEIIRDRGKEG